MAIGNLRFPSTPSAAFFTALQTKGFVILSGISGTGKTKLAQQFAGSLPQSRIAEPAERDDVIAFTAQPYMVKYGLFALPKTATRLFEPPALGESKEIRLTFDGQSQSCVLSQQAEESRPLRLFLRGSARRWFRSNVTPGEALILEPELDSDQYLLGFRLAKASQLPQAPAAEQQSTPIWLFISVRPDWRDGKSLLGYYNPLTQTYEWTPFLRFLTRAVQSYRSGDGLAWFVILDEMNLARVEYYFAELLSVLESGRDEAGWTREPLRLGFPEEAEGDLPPRELRLPSNLYVVGTVNADETTHAFSPKVLDRAFSLELSEVDFSDYPPRPDPDAAPLSDEDRQALLRAFTRGGRFARIDKAAVAAYVGRRPEVRAALQALNAALRPHNLHFGYRVFDEIVAFLDAAEENGMFAEIGGGGAAFDAAVLMKVLPKFHGSRGKLEAPLEAVLAWCEQPGEGGAPRCPRTAERIRRMLRELETDGFTAFG